MGTCSRWMGNSLLKATIVDVQVWFTVVTSVGKEVPLEINAYTRGWPWLEKQDMSYNIDEEWCQNDTYCC
jgi:hypothetical protein